MTTQIEKLTKAIDTLAEYAKDDDIPVHEAAEVTIVVDEARAALAEIAGTSAPSFALTEKGHTVLAEGQ